MEGLVIAGIAIGFSVLLARSIRERARAGYGPIPRWSGRRERQAGLTDDNFEGISEPRSRRF